MAHQQRPNVLFLLSDSHAPLISGYAGDANAGTAAIDALAANGVVFDTASCASPLCTPSRMCLLAGKEAHRCAAWNNHWVIFPEYTTWPGHFASHGYTTALVGKMHLGGANQMQGFQYRPYGDLRHGLGHQPEPLSMFPGYGYASSAGPCEIPESLIQDVVVTREALGFIREHVSAKPETPWFVCASYGRPHPPLTAPERYLRKYAGRADELRAPADRNGIEKLDPFNRWIVESKMGDELDLQIDRAGVEGFYACLDFMDDCIGELLDGLRRDGLLDNTIIIYTSDHGEMLGMKCLWGKTTYFEPSMGVPLVFTGPGIDAGGKHTDAPVSLLDLFPTTCGLCGLPVPDGLDGVDLSALLRDPDGAESPRDFAPSSFFRYGVRVRGGAGAPEHEPAHAWRAIRQRDWKYVEVEGADPLLFDMNNDPDETHNLAADPGYAEQCREMRAKLFANFSWDLVHQQIAEDRERLPHFLSGHKPSTPNQYMLPDGRVFDAEAPLYDARWLALPPNATGGIIPQQFG